MTHRTLQEANVAQVIFSAVRSTPGVEAPLSPLHRRIVNNVVRVLAESDMNHKLYAMEQLQGPMDDVERETLLDSIAYLNGQKDTIREHFLGELKHRDDYIAGLSNDVRKAGDEAVRDRATIRKLERENKALAERLRAMGE